MPRRHTHTNTHHAQTSHIHTMPGYHTSHINTHTHHISYTYTKPRHHTYTQTSHTQSWALTGSVGPYRCQGQVVPRADVALSNLTRSESAFQKSRQMASLGPDEPDPWICVSTTKRGTRGPGSPAWPTGEQGDIWEITHSRVTQAILKHPLCSRERSFLLLSASCCCSPRHSGT